MTEEKRGLILGYVGDIPVANPYYSGKLSGMTVEQLQARLRELNAADEADEDSDETFMARMGEMDAIRAEIKRKQETQQG